MSMITRQLLEPVRQALATMPAVAILGPRQVGKTTLAKQLAAQLVDEPLVITGQVVTSGQEMIDQIGQASPIREALYLDLELPDIQSKLQDPVGFLSAHQDKLIIFDEIQLAPELFQVLRGLIDANGTPTSAHPSGPIERRNGQFLLLGSASMDLLRQSSESLAGRIRYLELMGLNALEVPAHPIETPTSHRPSRRSHPPHLSWNRALWLRGGFPEAYLAHSDAAAMDWLEDLVRTYLERDIAQWGFRIPATRLRRLWTMLAHLQGSVINASKLARSLDVDAKTVSHHLDVLVDLLLIRRLPPWHHNVKKRLVKSPHYYIRDTGILHRLLGIDDHDALLGHPILGKSFEGFVIENLLSVLPRRAKASFYGTAAGGEIDLVLELSATEIWAVEIKYGRSPKIPRHFQSLADDVGATERIIVFSGEEVFPIKGGGQVMGLVSAMEALLHR